MRSYLYAICLFSFSLAVIATVSEAFVGSNSLLYKARTVDCGETIQRNNILFFPQDMDCDLEIAVPEDHTVIMEVSDINGKRIKSRHITVVTDSGRRLNFRRFNGTNSHYSLQVRELPHPLILNIIFIKSTFSCEDIVPFNFYGIPLTLTTTSESCTLIISSPGLVKVQLNHHPFKKCSTTAQALQGYRLDHMSLGTEEACLSVREPIEFLMLCDAKVLRFSGAPAEITVTVFPYKFTHTETLQCY